MKTKQIEIKTTKTVYVAGDGTEFEDSHECERYDKTAIGVLRSRIHPLIVNRGTEYSVTGIGCDENVCWVVVPKTVEDIMLIRQLLVIYGNRIEYAESVKESDVDKHIILIWSLDSDSLWFTKLDDMVNLIKGIKSE